MLRVLRALRGEPLRCNVLKLDTVSKTFRGPTKMVAAAADVCLEAPAGGFVAVQGPSGCGKTTLLLLAGALLAPDAGHVLIDGQDPYALSPEQRARLRAARLGFVFQQFHLVPYLSALDNILAAALATAGPRAPLRERAHELAAAFGLSDRLDHVPAQLSVGERQRVALARALFNRPRLILADEPTGNLDRDNAKIVLDALAAFARDGGTVLLVTHDPSVAQYAQRIVTMKAGRLT